MLLGGGEHRRDQGGNIAPRVQPLDIDAEGRVARHGEHHAPARMRQRELDAARRAQPRLAMVGAAAMPARRGEAEFGRGSAEMAGEHEACQRMGNEIACAILVAAEPRPATALVRVEQRQQLAMPGGGARPPDLAFARAQGRNRH